MYAAATEADNTMTMKKILFLSILLSLYTCLVYAADHFHSTPRGALYQDMKTGTGDTAEIGDIATIQFVFWIDNNGKKGKQIYDTHEHDETISFVIGTERVMPGWNEGVIGMKPGGRRLLKLPAELGYGDREVQGVVPPNARLIFIIDLIRLEKHNLGSE
jgi:FKBP-type peptidyl-prolyl cis-trans isomerase